MKKQSPQVKKFKNPQAAILSKCLDCSGNSKQEVLFCPITDCPLYTFRCKQAIDEFYNKVVNKVTTTKKRITKHERRKKDA